MNIWYKTVGIIKQRINNTRNEITWFRRKNKMSQARVLSEKELNLLLLFINTRKYSARDRAMVLMTHLAGMRVKEVAGTRIIDVLANDGTVKNEIVLKPSQTKGKYARTIVLSSRLQKELRQYLLSRFTPKELIAVPYCKDEYNKPLFKTQKSNGFSANTLCYHFHMLYKAAGLEGASSHSGRRHFLTKLSGKGVALRTMMELAGHRQAQTTMRYIDVTDDMKRAAVELI
ncbi:site-specific integrase [Methylophaga sp.]|uniref:tyrosine-type recombinase/integrase n=1 Tax=Methylophaga sp. TaxID=2024840 RepID=UPI0025D16C4A|nr:site-specific integrase [Methylophaga sp.]